MVCPHFCPSTLVLISYSAPWSIRWNGCSSCQGPCLYNAQPDSYFPSSYAENRGYMPYWCLLYPGDELSIFPSLDFAFFLKVNNNSTTSKALSRLPENHYRFCIHSNIIDSLSVLRYSLPLSDILPLKNNQDFVCNTTSKSGNTGNAEYRD